jgi:hypothetical protein
MLIVICELWVSVFEADAVRVTANLALLAE